MEGDEGRIASAGNLIEKADAGSTAYTGSLADDIVDSFVGSKNKDFFLSQAMRLISRFDKN
ncbi:MAG: hypothetical protein MJ228_04630 [Bacilli bacterium]|nr:hypothetical protein [Bacilli bacterium]